MQTTLLGLDPSQLCVFALVTPAKYRNCIWLCRHAGGRGWVRALELLRLTQWSVSFSLITTGGPPVVSSLWTPLKSDYSSNPCVVFLTVTYLFNQNCHVLWQILVNWCLLTTKFANLGSWRVGMIYACNCLSWVDIWFISRCQQQQDEHIKSCEVGGLGLCDPNQSNI